MEALYRRLDTLNILDQSLHEELAALWKYGVLPIENEPLRAAIEGFLCIVPSHFFLAPASRSGRLHPPWQNGAHGTLRSIVESCVILPDVAKHIPEIVDAQCRPNQEALDIAFAATIISDSWKKEEEGDVHHGPMHGHVAAAHWCDFIEAHAPALDRYVAFAVSQASKLHYGVFTPGWDRTKKLPPIARLVNLCDVITSLPSLKTIYDGKLVIE